jgi:hypothetical protein
MFDTFLILAPFLILLIVALLRFTGCAELAGVQSVKFSTITLSPLPPGLSPTGGLGPGMSVTFQPMVNGNPMSTAALNVMFVVTGPGKVAQDGTYTAPFPRDPTQPQPAIATVGLKDTSSGMPIPTASAKVTLEPATVSISLPPDALRSLGMWQFTAVVKNVSPPSGQQVQAVWKALYGKIPPNPSNSLSPTYTAPKVTANTVTVDTVSYTINNTDPQPEPDPHPDPGFTAGNFVKVIVVP